MKGMRLLVVMPDIVSYHSFLKELCLHLCAHGVEVHVGARMSQDLVPPGTGTGTGGPVLHDLPLARGMHPVGHAVACMALRRLVREVAPDIIHAHFDAAIFATALARQKHWPPALATFHGMSFPMLRGSKRWLVRRASAWAASQFQKVFVLHEENRQALKSAAPAARIEVWPGFGVGCDLDRFRPAPIHQRTELRTGFGFGPGDRVFAYVGRFIEAKGFALAARAFLQLSLEDPDVRLLLVGAADPLHPTGLTKEEEQKLQESTRVVWAGNRHDVERYLGAADVLLLPSRREGMPVCLMEALAMGVPVISSQACGCREVVREGVDGFQVEGVQALVVAMRRLASDGALRQRFAAAALAGRRRFGRERFIHTQTEVYLNVIENPRLHAATATPESVG